MTNKNFQFAKKCFFTGGDYAEQKKQPGAVFTKVISGNESLE